MKNKILKLLKRKTILNALAGLVATTATVYAQERGVDVVVEPEWVAVGFLMLGQIFQRAATEKTDEVIEDNTAAVEDNTRVVRDAVVQNVIERERE